MTAEEFNDCLQQIANGSEEALEKIYNKYQAKLIFTARLELKNAASAEEVVSEVFFSIWKNAANYGYVEKPKAWMFQALKFAIINYKKKNYKYIYTESIDEAYYAKGNSADFKVALKLELEKLTERQRDIFKLHYLFDISIDDAAEELEISRSTVNREIEVIKQRLEYLK